MSYRVPDELHGRLQVGSTVVVPLSGYSRLGIVVEVGERPPERSLEEVRRVLGGLSLGPEIVGLCRWVSENAALPLSVVLRNALPPGLRVDLYRVVAPDDGWGWRRGSLVERSALRNSLGKDGLKEAESGGRIVLSPAPARREIVEWVVSAQDSPDLSRAPRQRELFEAILPRGACRVRPLLEETGARRETLRALAARGAVHLERRSGSSPVEAARGSREPVEQHLDGADVARGGAYLMRVAGGEQTSVVADLCRTAVERWDQTLVLAPEVRDVEKIVADLVRLLPAGTTVAPYHSGLGRDRATVYEAARQGAVDVLVGTRAAALAPLSRPGAICVVDEPNPAHRAEPGFEGIPLHTRDISVERGRREEATVLMLSPAPSLIIYAALDDGVRELAAPETVTWPEARIVDMRGSGAPVSGDLLDACRRAMEDKDGVGVVVNRLGYATAVSCASCGTVVVCRSCGLPLVLHGGLSAETAERRKGEMVCHHCASRSPVPGGCDECGSGRMIPTGVGVERARDLLSERLGEKVGMATAGRTAGRDSGVVVGTAHEILSESWDTVLVPDADSLLFGGDMFASERGFRTLYSAADSARRLVAVQTRNPQNAVLGAALRGDYPAFADQELSRRRRAGYPPYRFLASLTLQGREPAVRRAVESLVGVRETGVEAMNPVPLVNGDSADIWKVVLRARSRADLASILSGAAEIPHAGSRRGPEPGEARRVQIELDPEEV